MAIDPDKTNEISEALNRQAEVIEKVSKNMDRQAETLKKLIGESDKAGLSIDSLTGSFDRFYKSDKRYDLSEFVESAQNAATNVSKTMSDVGGGVIKYMEQTVNTVNEAIADGSTNIASLLKGMTGMGVALLGKMGVEMLYKTVPGFKALQEVLKPTQKSIMQMTIPFAELRDTATQTGGAFAQAQGNVSSFNSYLARSIETTKNSREVVSSVAVALGKTFGPETAIQPLNNLRNVYDKLNSDITQTNAALLIATATGTDHSTIVSMMESAYLDLGSNIDDTVGMFGQLFDAATRSGIGFERTAKTIMEGAKTLKFWGGTVESVTPLFNTFAQSLRGIGRQGLTPELLQSFVGGLNQMTTSTRALLAMQTPGMRGAGILGGGLRMEAALEKGPEGMREVTSSLLDTLKKFGGPQILTREQAIESPALTRNYMIQRQLLGQMMGINDPARQNQMMRILQDIDKGGMAVGVDTEQRLGELLSSGEDIGNETVQAIEQMDQHFQAGILKQGELIATSIQNIMRETGGSEVIQGLNDFLARAATEGISPLELMNEIMDISLVFSKAAKRTDASTLEKTAKRTDASTLEKTTKISKEREREKRDLKTGMLKGEMFPLFEKYTAQTLREVATPRQRERFEQTGRMSGDMLKNVTTSVMAEMREKIKHADVDFGRKDISDIQGLAQRMFENMSERERQEMMAPRLETEQMAQRARVKQEVELDIKTKNEIEIPVKFVLDENNKTITLQISEDKNATSNTVRAAVANSND